MTATAARPTFRTRRAAALDAEIAAAERTADKAARAAREALARVNDLRAQRDRLTRADRAVAVAACTPGE